MNNLREIVAAVSGIGTYRFVDIQIDTGDLAFNDRRYVDLAFMETVVAAVRRVYILAHDGEALLIAKASPLGSDLLF